MSVLSRRSFLQSSAVAAGAAAVVGPTARALATDKHSSSSSSAPVEQFLEQLVEFDPVRRAVFDPGKGPLWAWFNMLTRAASVDWVRHETSSRARERYEEHSGRSASQRITSKESKPVWLSA